MDMMKAKKTCGHQFREIRNSPEHSHARQHILVHMI